MQSRSHLEVSCGVIYSVGSREFFWHFKRKPSNWASDNQGSPLTFWSVILANIFQDILNVWLLVHKMNPQSLFNRIIGLIIFIWSDLILIFRDNVSEACMLIEMSSEGVSCMIKSFISSADETSSFHNVMSVIKSWSGKVLVNWMDFEPFKWVNWSDSVLPNVSYDIVESIVIEHVYWIWRKPVFQVNVSYFFVFPSVQIFI